MASLVVQNYARKILWNARIALVTFGFAIALQSCSAQQPPSTHSATSPMVYEPLAPVTRAPLSAPPGYAASEDQASNSLGSHERGFTDVSETGGLGVWHESPRWAAVQGDGCIEVKREPRTEFTAEAKPPKFKVKSCLEENY